jgi:sulfatase maturation enzyme AslB (radical SAM superfamily)
MRRKSVWHSKQESSSEDEGSFSWDDDEKMALLVKKFSKFMVKDYRARRKKSSSKNKEESKRCFNCGSKDYLVAQCTYNSDNDDDDKKSKKKDKKKKKRRRTR